MDNLIKQSYASYGNYVNNSRALPLVIDGLKPVERRILLTAYLIARDKEVKSARVNGTCIAKFHPHGDTYGTIVQLVKQGFLIGQGNFGNNLGVIPSPPAAQRYTECGLSSFVKKMAFSYINYIDFVESELDDEPPYLPTMFPLCLLGKEYLQGIGFGFSTKVPCYTLEDLKKRLYWKLNPKLSKPIIKPISNCKITATDEELEHLLTTGKAKISVVGKTVKNNIKSTITVKSWPPGKGFDAALLKKKNIKKQLENGDIGYVDSSNGEKGTNIVFSVLKQRNRFKIFKELDKNIKDAVTGNVPFETNTVDLNGNVKVTPIDYMLVETFKMFRNTNVDMLNSEISKANILIHELECLEKIRRPLSEILAPKYGKVLTKEELIKNYKYISDISGVDVEVIKTLTDKYRIRKLLTISTDTSNIKVKVDDFKDKLKNINNFVIKQYTEI